MVKVNPAEPDAEVHRCCDSLSTDQPKKELFMALMSPKIIDLVTKRAL